MKKYSLYAIGEIVLVVLGILIALQINTWNQNRLDRKTETKILHELKEDILTNVQTMKRQDLFLKQMLEEVEHAQSFLGKANIEIEIAKKILRPFFSHKVVTFDPVSGSLDNILNSDKLNLIKNEELRRKISAWNGLLSDTKEEEQKLLGFKQTQLIPFMMECCSYSKEISKNDSSVFSNFRFANQLAVFHGLIRRQVIDYQPAKKYFEEILILIDQELDEK